MKMNKWLWYGLVIIAVFLLVNSIVKENLVLGLFALALALLLKTQYHKIPLPKGILKHTRYSKQEIDERFG